MLQDRVNYCHLMLPTVEAVEVHILPSETMQCLFLKDSRGSHNVTTYGGFIVHCMGRHSPPAYLHANVLAIAYVSTYINTVREVPRASWMRHLYSCLPQIHTHKRARTLTHTHTCTHMCAHTLSVTCDTVTTQKISM